MNLIRPIAFEESQLIRLVHLMAIITDWHRHLLLYSKTEIRCVAVYECYVFHSIYDFSCCCCCAIVNTSSLCWSCCLALCDANHQYYKAQKWTRFVVTLEIEMSKLTPYRKYAVYCFPRHECEYNQYRRK